MVPSADGAPLASAPTSRHEGMRRPLHLEQAIVSEIVRVASTDRELEEQIHRLAALLEEWSGCGGVRILLCAGDGLPDPAGDDVQRRRAAAPDRRSIDRDRSPTGEPSVTSLLEHMCRTVLAGGMHGHHPPSFTRGGSFWTNRLTELPPVATSASAESPAPRPSVGSGYESVALVPLRAATTTLGLLQLGDARRDMLSLETIQTLEAWAGVLALSVAFRRTAPGFRDRKEPSAQRWAANGRIAARVTHEIANPLAGIQNALHLIADAVPRDHPDRDMVELVDREIDRVIKIVQQAQEPGSSGAPAIAAECRVEKVIDDVLLMLEPLRREYEVAIDATTVPEGLTIRTADDGLESILFNLVANAIEASPPCGVVRIVAAATADVFHLMVNDRGSGIPPELQDRVFEPLFTTKPPGRGRAGFGLGLSIVEETVESLGGSIGIRSKRGWGTSVRVRLPRSRENQTEGRHDDLGLHPARGR